MNKNATGKKSRKGPELAQRIRTLLIDALDLVDKDSPSSAQLLAGYAERFGAVHDYPLIEPAEHIINAGVYLVEAVGSGMYKIGVAGDIRARMKSLSSGCPFQLRLLAVIGDESRLSEHREHKRYAEYRTHGEWFQLPPNVVIEIITSCNNR